MTVKQNLHSTTPSGGYPAGLSRRGFLVRLFLTCWLVFALHFATNIVREIYPALSLGDHLSFDVSEYEGLHPDIFRLPGRGVFINNNPGASILGAIPYAISRPVIDRAVERVAAQRAASGAQPPEYDSIYPMAREFYQESFRRGLDVKFGLAAGVMQIFLMAPLSALSAVAMFLVLESRLRSTKPAALLALLYAFATPVLYRTAQLNHNILQAHFAFFAFVLLWRPWDNRRPGYALAGLLAGWTLVLDYSGLVILACLGIYVLMLQGAPKDPSLYGWRRYLAPALQYAAGAAVSVAVLLVYQWTAFGNPFLPAQNYMPATAFSGFGYQGMGWPSLDLLGLLSFGQRYGLFTSAPLLVLALYAPNWFSQANRLTPRRETTLILLLTVAVFLFTSANQFSRLQFNSGIRHVVPVVPFIFLLAAAALLRLPGWLATLAGLFGVYWSWALAMHRDVEQGNGILDAILQISTHGPRLPWLATLKNLEVLPGAMQASMNPWVFLAAAGLFLAGLWLLRFPLLDPARGASVPPAREQELQSLRR